MKTEMAVSACEYACPNCLGDTLEDSEQALACSPCGKRYALEDGIPVFRERPATFAWGAPLERMEAALEDVRRLGWHDAMMRLFQELSPNEAELIWVRTLGLRRLAMQMLLPMGRAARVLDFGSGWGTIALHLAGHGADVVAFDQLALHLRWLRAASAAHQLRPITLVQGGDTKHLPFPAESFDAVILNGVLEHVAGNTAGDPQAVQQRVLEEVARILRPCGQVYIGIENRLNYKYFLGVREGHIKMKYGALLPRPVTRWYLQWRRNQPFREYTYSLRGYQRLLRRAGLVHQRFFAPWPNYSSAGDFFPVDGTRQCSVWRVKSWHPVAHRPGWYFARAFGMTASHARAEASVLEKILQEVALRTERPLPWTLKHSVFRVTSGGKAVVRMAPKGGPEWYMQIGLTPLACRRIAAQHRATSQLRTLPLPAELAARLPSSVLTGEIDGYFYGVRPHLAGKDGGALIHHAATRRALCEQAESFLCALHTAAGRRVRLDEAWFERLVGAPIASVRQWFTEEEWQAHAPWFAERTAWIKTRLMSVELCVVPYHGDFVPENCIWDAQAGELSQVLDWELYDEAGLPMVDWVTFLGCAYRPQVKADMRERGEDPTQTKFHGYPFMFFQEPLRSVLTRYLDRLGLNPIVLEPLVFMWWMKQLQDWAPLHLYNPEWRRFRLFPVIQRWKQVTGTSSL